MGDLFSGGRPPLGEMAALVLLAPLPGVSITPVSNVSHRRPGITSSVRQPLSRTRIDPVGGSTLETSRTGSSSQMLSSRAARVARVS